MSSSSADEETDDTSTSATSEEDDTDTNDDAHEKREESTTGSESGSDLESELEQLKRKLSLKTCYMEDDKHNEVEVFKDCNANNVKEKGGKKGKASSLDATAVDVEPVTLTSDMVKSGLSGLARSLVNMKYTYSKLNVQKKKINNIQILSSFIHLRFLDLSNNYIKNLKPLGCLEFLEVLNVSNNHIEKASDIPMLKHLKHLNLRNNRLETLAGFLPNFITHLNVSENKLEALEGLTSYIFPNITHLELRKNYINNLKPLQLPRLEQLFIAENLLTSVNGLNKCPMLRVLHARGNRISRLKDFPSLVKLEYVNLRQNDIRRFTEATNLIHSPNIRVLILIGNPLAQSCIYRSEMTIALSSSLQRLDKTKVLEIELEEGKKVLRGRMRGQIQPVTDDPAVLTPPPSPRPLPNDPILVDGQSHVSSSILCEFQSPVVGNKRDKRQTTPAYEHTGPPNTAVNGKPSYRKLSFEPKKKLSEILRLS